MLPGRVPAGLIYELVAEAVTLAALLGPRPQNVITPDMF
jgi:hypothetical protein